MAVTEWQCGRSDGHWVAAWKKWQSQMDSRIAWPRSGSNRCHAAEDVACVGNGPTPFIEKWSPGCFVEQRCEHAKGMIIVGWQELCSPLSGQSAIMLSVVVCVRARATMGAAAGGQTLHLESTPPFPARAPTRALARHPRARCRQRCRLRLCAHA